jgi:hypothetical protein
MDADERVFPQDVIHTISMDVNRIHVIPKAFTIFTNVTALSIARNQVSPQDQTRSGLECAFFGWQMPKSAIRSGWFGPTMATKQRKSAIRNRRFGNRQSRIVDFVQS